MGCKLDIKTQYDIEKHKSGYEGHIEGSYPGGGGGINFKRNFSNQRSNSWSYERVRSSS